MQSSRLKGCAAAVKEFWKYAVPSKGDTIEVSGESRCPDCCKFLIVPQETAGFEDRRTAAARRAARPRPRPPGGG